LASDGFSIPQDVHLRLNGAAQLMQNLAEAEFSTPQLEQRTRFSQIKLGGALFRRYGPSRELTHDN
jgi:hypothetical protein